MNECGCGCWARDGCLEFMLGRNTAVASFCDVYCCQERSNGGSRFKHISNVNHGTLSKRTREHRRSSYRMIPHVDSCCALTCYFEISCQTHLFSHLRHDCALREQQKIKMKLAILASVVAGASAFTSTTPAVSECIFLLLVIIYLSDAIVFCLLSFFFISLTIRY